MLHHSANELLQFPLWKSIKLQHYLTYFEYAGIYRNKIRLERYSRQAGLACRMSRTRKYRNRS